MKKMKKRILLTGGGGMVGKNLREDSKASSYEVWAPNRTEVDLLDAGATRQAVQDFRPDLVLHAAGKVGGIAANIAEPYAFLFENLEMGKNILDASVRAKVPRFLNLSSSCVYPREGKNPLVEESLLMGPLEPTNEGYALAKIAVMRLGEFASKQNKIAFRSVIPCNLYGKYDHFDTVKSHLVPSVLLKVHAAKIQNAATIEIWGSGEARREFMYAGDLASLLWDCVERFDELPLAMNLGLGHDHRVKDYYEIAARVLGWSGKFVHDLSKPEGMRQKLVDHTKMSRMGLAAPTSLESGLRLTYDYYLETLRPKGDSA